MIEVREVDAQSDERGHRQHARGREPPCRFPLAYGRDEKGQRHQGHDHQEIIAHLYVVGQDLQGQEEGRDEPSPQISAAIA